MGLGFIDGGWGAFGSDVCWVAVWDVDGENGLHSRRRWISLGCGCGVEDGPGADTSQTLRFKV